MNLFRQTPKAVATASGEHFDLLRARLEAEVARPAIIVITSSTAIDVPEVAADGLARSLATTGYPTLFIDAAPGAPTSTKAVSVRTLEEAARQVEPASGIGNLSVLALSDSSLQKTTSQRNIQAAVQSLREKFDFVVVTVEGGDLGPFATSMVAAADAVFVTIKAGRREKRSDARLATVLKRLGVRFLGVISIDSSIADAYWDFGPRAEVSKDVRIMQPAHVEKEYIRREAVEWPR